MNQRLLQKITKPKEKLLRDSVLCLLFVIALMTGRSQIVITDHPPRLSHSTLRMMVIKTDSVMRALWPDSWEILRADILKSGTDVYLCPDGHFNVYIWKNNEWVNLNKGIGFGWNFDSKKFIYNQTIYSYGGYGFWHEHGEVIRFDKEKGMWEMLPYTKNLQSGLASFSGHTLYIFGPKSYHIDLKKEKVLTIEKTLYQVVEGRSKNPSTLQLENYTIDAGRNILIDEKNQAIYATNNIADYIIKTQWKNKNNIWLITGDSLSQYNRPFQFVKGFQIFNMIDQFSPIPEDAARNSSILFLMFGGLISILFLLMWFGLYREKKKRNGKNLSLEENNLHVTIESLLRSNQKVYTAEDLERLFRIDATSSPETIRYKRAQMIREINYFYQKKTGLELITRLPDPTDGRRYIYEINGLEK